jgi:hypothetical protein
MATPKYVYIQKLKGALLVQTIGYIVSHTLFLPKKQFQKDMTCTTNANTLYA